MFWLLSCFLLAIVFWWQGHTWLALLYFFICIWNLNNWLQQPSKKARETAAQAQIEEDDRKWREHWRNMDGPEDWQLRAYLKQHFPSDHEGYGISR